MKNATKWFAGIAAVASLVAATGGLTSYAATTTLAETGSSLLYPLFNGEWVPAYQRANSNIQISSASTGSGTGISQSIAGIVQIGASDAYLSNAQMAQASSMLNIPLVISAQQIMYNLPGVKQRQHLHLTGHILAEIYEGQITNWDDPQIAKINKGFKLPDHTIQTVERSDGSGDTFLFTQFLSDTDSTWNSNVGFGTTVSWPKTSTLGIGAKGNDGIVAALQNNPYSISYVGISWLSQAKSLGLGYAALKNASGKYVLPTPATIHAAATIGAKHVPADERKSLIFMPGKNSYPIINFEYAIVNSKQPAGVAAELKKFLSWCLTTGNHSKYLNAVHMLPLPANIVSLSEKQISKIGQ